MTKLRRWIVRLLMVLAVALPLAAIALYVVNPFGANSYDPRQRIIGYGPYRVPSRSMAPTVNPDQIVIMRAGYYSNHEPRRGDIVIFIHQQDGNHWIKRVVGLPGERIAIEDGVVRIDGRELVEDYVAAENVETDYSREMAIQKVPQDAYFLLGDNRDNSEDARIFGATRRDSLVGKVVSVLK
jgi:signal peptidase I